MSQIHWRPGIGDPTIAGWLTVAAYFAAFLLSVIYIKQIGSETMTGRTVVQYRLWWFIALAMLLMGINKQLDLQTLLTEVGKILSKRQGWYEQRRIVQIIFIAGVGCGGLFSLMLVWQSCKNLWKENWLTIVGLIFLVCFVVMRATSFHHMDLFLGSYISGFKINWFFELGGISFILASAIKTIKHHNAEFSSTIEHQDIFI